MFEVRQGIIPNEIEKRKVDLRITLDLPQLFTAHRIDQRRMELMDDLFAEVQRIRHNIHGIHLWGKRKSEKGRRVAHVGDLNSYFDYDAVSKERFLRNMHDVFGDNVKRYFVPEVNSGSEDLQSIVCDLINAGFKFI